MAIDCIFLHQLVMRVVGLGHIFVWEGITIGNPCSEEVEKLLVKSLRFVCCIA